MSANYFVIRNAFKRSLIKHEQRENAPLEWH